MEELLPTGGKERERERGEEGGVKAVALLGRGGCGEEELGGDSEEKKGGEGEEGEEVHEEGCAEMVKRSKDVIRRGGGGR